jgi:hypothetical protein
MRKEVIFAIILGFALGLIITLGIWQANKAIKNQQIQNTNTGESVLPTQTDNPTNKVVPFSLTIVKPEDESLSSTATTTVSGSTEPGTQIVVIGEKSEEIIEADENGVFSTEIGLVSGTNEITVTAYSNNGDEATKSILVVYSTSEI